MSEKINKAIEACNKVLNGLEDETISISSGLKLCLKVARLTNDEENLKWLMYESGGYPRAKDGNIELAAFNIGARHGRSYIEKGQKHIFLELASELESKIASAKMQSHNFTTNGASTAGDYAVIAMNNLTNSVVTANRDLLSIISTCEKRLMILGNQYYDYALKKSIELSFGNISQNIFESYRETVNGYLSNVSKETLMKLQAIDESMQSDNSEMYSQTLTTCRRLYQELIAYLFECVSPKVENNLFKTKSGKEIDVSGEHFNNKLSAIIETLEDRTVKKSLIGSSIMYYLDWIENLTSLQSKGVHNNISLEEARSCIIQTYIFAGEIINLYNNSNK